MWPLLVQDRPTRYGTAFCMHGEKIPGTVPGDTVESTLHVHVVDDEREPLCGVCLLATATWGGRSLVPRDGPARGSRSGRLK